MKKLLICLAVVLGLAACSKPADGQVFSWSATDVVVEQGATEVSTYSVDADVAGASITGLQFLGTWDPGLGLSVAAVTPTATLTGLAPDFVDGTLETDEASGVHGFSYSVVFDFTTATGVDFFGGVDLFELSIMADAAATIGTSALTFADSVPFSPPGQNLAVEGVASSFPIVDGVVVGSTGQIDVVAPAVFVDYTVGDTDDDGVRNLVDVIQILSSVSLGFVSACPAAEDTNADLTVDVQDAIFLLSYLFQAGVSPGLECTATVVDSACPGAAFCP